jgi:hypothetical protein
VATTKKEEAQAAANSLAQKLAAREAASAEAKMAGVAEKLAPNPPARPDTGAADHPERLTGPTTEPAAGPDVGSANEGARAPTGDTGGGGEGEPRRRAAPVGGSPRTKAIGFVLPQDLGKRLDLWKLQRVREGGRGEVADIVEQSVAALRKGDTKSLVRFLQTRYQPQGRIVADGSLRVNTRVTQATHQKLALYVAELRLDDIRTTMQAVVTFLLDRDLPHLDAPS